MVYNIGKRAGCIYWYSWVREMNGEMKILIAKSEDVPNMPGPFQIKYGGEFAKRRFIPHITDYKDGKFMCCRRCLDYRKKYRLDLSEKLAGIIEFPAVLPELVDDPETYITRKLPDHDILVAIGIHPDIFPELLKRAADVGCRALIAPREDPSWMDKAFLSRLKEICESQNMEYAFPRPFCSLVKGKFELINEFIEQFRIGRPEYEFIPDGQNKIEDVKVIRSSPCGATYFVASGLIGLSKGEILEEANHLWTTYPCISSGGMDPELNDLIMHVAGHINANAARMALEKLGGVKDAD